MKTSQFDIRDIRSMSIFSILHNACMRYFLYRSVDESHKPFKSPRWYEERRNQYTHPSASHTYLCTPCFDMTVEISTYLSVQTFGSFGESKIRRE